MAIFYQISQITASSGVGFPGKIKLAIADGNLTNVFQGKFFRDPSGVTQPGYTLPAPVGFTLISATTFDIVGNPSYNGRYTVYSKTSGIDLNNSSEYTSLSTTISVNETVSAPMNVSDDLGVGQVTNVSTYVIKITGESDLVIPPAVIFADRPIDLIGRDGSPWGQSYSQNFIDLAQNFADSSAPANSYLGQTWYDNSLNQLNLKSTSGWVTIASGVAGANTTFRFTQASAISTWTIDHNLGLAAPYVAMIQIFVDTGANIYKMMHPQDITFTNSNQIVVTFTNPQNGIALIRA